MDAISDSDEEIAEDGVFNVRAIIDHDRFDNLVNRVLKREIVFQPRSLGDNETTHCKYGYLVHWKGFNKYDRTWEPEENVLKLALLDEYKRSHGMKHTPGQYETFSKKYDIHTREKVSAFNERLSKNMVSMSAEYNKAKKLKMKEKERLKKLEEAEALKSSVKPKTKENVARVGTPTRGGVAIKKRRVEDDVVITSKPIDVVEITTENLTMPSSENVTTPSTSATSVEEEITLNIRAPLPHRSFETHLNLRRNRRCESVERLNERWKEKTEIELMSWMHFMINDCCGENEVKTKRDLTTETKQLMMLRLKAEEKEEAQLIKTNQSHVRKFLDVVKTKLNENHWEGIDEVVAMYTADCFQEFEEILRQFPDVWRFLIIQSLIFTCKTYSSWQAQQLWVKRAKKTRRGNDRLFMESDEDVISDVPFHVEKCSAEHTKCTWLGIFLSMLPENLRFEESSGYNFSSSNKGSSEENSDGPFRDDMFLHCMRFGADCQKLKFLMYGTPLGDSLTEEYGYNVDYVHLVCCQGTSLRRIQQFMAVGFDIHPIATIVETGQLLELKDYIKTFWKNCVETKEEKGQKINPVQMKYYEELPKMIQKISAEMTRLITCEHEKNIAIKSKMLLKIDLSITNPHILRCSPTQNMNNYGDGEHQVATCLFFEQGCSFKSGLREELEQNKDEIRCAKILKECRERIKAKRGRFVLCVYRVNIMVAAQDGTSDEITLPSFEFVRSDEKMRIDGLSVIPMNRIDKDDPKMRMKEMVEFRSPGQRIFAFDKLEMETEILKPGPAHIEMKGNFEIPMNFLVQIVFVKNKVSKSVSTTRK